MNDDELNRRELTGDDALRLARESGMEEASRGSLFYAGVGDLIRFARLVRAGWRPQQADASIMLTQHRTWRTSGPGGACVRVCEISDAECSRGCNVGPCVRAGSTAASGVAPSREPKENDRG
jgi:hypothetical protein